MVESGRLRLESHGEVLRISPLELSDSGNYTCEAGNHFGRDKITYTLDVRRKKGCFTDQFKGL